MLTLAANTKWTATSNETWNRSLLTAIANTFECHTQKPVHGLRLSIRSVESVLQCRTFLHGAEGESLQSNLGGHSSHDLTKPAGQQMAVR